MKLPTIDLTDPDLFGNDAAELEEESIFQSYVLERDEVTAFVDARRKIRVARAYKGEGKSALLRLAKNKVLSADNDAPLVISTTGPAVSPDVQGADSDRWVKAWKERMLRLVACEVGSRIGMAWTDDAIALVEEAERNGYKARSPISSIIDRLKSKHVPLETARIGTDAPGHVLKRYTKEKAAIWIIVDDIDQNFQNTDVFRAKVAAFFTACRQLVTDVPALRLRLAVRPNVWTIIKREFESLSHIEQYMADLSWNQTTIRQLLAQRIEGYLRRTDQEAFLANLHEDAWPRDETLIRFVFETPMDWGHQKRPPHVVLATLCRYRPRWLIELCKEAGNAASKKGKTSISLSIIKDQLRSFGRRRISDTIAEFKSQCPEIEDLITAFAQQFEEYKTNELIEVIERRILPGVHPRIQGVTGMAKPIDVAAFLYEIGFLTARRDFADDSYEHLSFSDNPSLLHSRTNVDQGVSWEIHPVFRQALDLKDKTWKERGKR